MKLLTTIFLLFLTVNFPAAEEKETADQMQAYDIELIIFEDAHARYINNESWQQDVSIDNASNNKPTENLNKLNLGEINTGSYKSLQPKILSSEYKRINGSSEYNVLFYSAWRQTGLDENSAFEIDINDLVNAHTNRSDNTINGTFKVVLARYLHFYADLDYQRQDDRKNISTETIDTTTDSATAAKEKNDSLISNQTYPMQIHRRMRSKELHYIDHPLVGLLIQINPAEKPKQ